MRFTYIITQEWFWYNSTCDSIYIITMLLPIFSWITTKGLSSLNQSQMISNLGFHLFEHNLTWSNPHNQIWIPTSPPINGPRHVPFHASIWGGFQNSRSNPINLQSPLCLIYHKTLSCKVSFDFIEVRQENHPNTSSCTYGCKVKSIMHFGYSFP